MEFINLLCYFLFGEKGRLPDNYQGSGIIIFALASSLMSVSVLILDFILFSIQENGRSIFNVSYGNQFIDIIRLILIWSIGAGIGAYIGVAANIFQITRESCLSVAVGWPFILPRLIDSFIRNRLEGEQTRE